MREAIYHPTSMRCAFEEAGIVPVGRKAGLGLKRVNSLWQVTINGKPKQRVRKT